MDNRGQHVVTAWQELRKSGGIAYSPEQLDVLLQGGDDRMLTREEVTERIRSYFLTCMTVEEDENGELIHAWKKNPTKTGLALALGVSNQTLCDYVKGVDRKGNNYKLDMKKNPQKVNTADFDLIRKAYQIVEDFYESKLADNRNNAGVIFWLNNRENTKWSNEQEFKFGSVEDQERQVVSVSELPRFNNQMIDSGILSDLPQFEGGDADV